MNRGGIGETSTFAGFHPIITAVYYVLVIGVTMFSMSPFFLCATFLASFAYSCLLKGKKTVGQNLTLALIILITMTLINGFFTHNGETVLFYINSNRITLEAFVFGAASSVMLVSVIIWFRSFNVLMPSDKLIYLFGRAAPVIGLVISMIFRFIPLLQHRFAEISMGQRCMGRSGQKGLLKKARQLTKEVSILIAWSLEASIESADSMAARGYGLPGRTSFHLFKITGRDISALVFMVLCGGISLYGCAAGYTGMYFYPKILLPNFGLTELAVLAAFCALAFMPLAIDIVGEYRWKKSSLTV